MKAQDIRKAAALLKIGESNAVERGCVAAYLSERGLAISPKAFLQGYLSGVTDEMVAACRAVLLSLNRRLDLEMLIELFELLVANDARKKNGVAYTPYSVKAMMLKRVLGEKASPTVFDPSCGCAAFLESDAFWFYGYHTSKPYSKGFMAFAKNYIIRFSIPQLDATARHRLFRAKSAAERNRLVWDAYGIANPPSLEKSPHSITSL